MTCSNCGCCMQEVAENVLQCDFCGHLHMETYICHQCSKEKLKNKMVAYKVNSQQHPFNLCRKCNMQNELLKKKKKSQNILNYNFRSYL